MLYLCEIKVQHTDLPKAYDELMDQARRIKQSPEFLKLDKVSVVPVLAVSNRLYQEELGYYRDKWVSVCETCKKLG